MVSKESEIMLLTTIFVCMYKIFYLYRNNLFKFRYKIEIFEEILKILMLCIKFW